MNYVKRAGLVCLTCSVLISLVSISKPSRSTQVKVHQPVKWSARSCCHPNICHPKLLRLTTPAFSNINTFVMSSQMRVRHPVKMIYKTNLSKTNTSNPHPTSPDPDPHFNPGQVFSRSQSVPKAEPKQMKNKFLNFCSILINKEILCQIMVT